MVSSTSRARWLVALQLSVVPDSASNGGYGGKWRPVHEMHALAHMRIHMHMLMIDIRTQMHMHSGLVGLSTACL